MKRKNNAKERLKIMQSLFFLKQYFEKNDCSLFFKVTLSDMIMTQLKTKNFKNLYDIIEILKKVNYKKELENSIINSIKVGE